MHFAYQLLKAYCVPKVGENLLLGLTGKEMLLIVYIFTPLALMSSLVSFQMVIKSTPATFFKLYKASEENNGEFIFFMLSQ